MNYAPAADPLALADHPDRGRISVYAQGADYHDIVKRALKAVARWLVAEAPGTGVKVFRSEEHTSELQSLMRISYAVFCLKKKKKQNKNENATITITSIMKRHKKYDKHTIQE